MAVLGITSCLIKGSRWTKKGGSFEISSLIKEGNRVFSRVLTIDPRETTYAYLENKRGTDIGLERKLISSIDVLIVRGTYGVVQPVSMLIRNLQSNGCCIIGPANYSLGLSPDKMNSTFGRHKRRVGIDTVVGFSKVGAIDALKKIGNGNTKIVIKPIYGRLSKGISRFDNTKIAKTFIEKWFASRDDKSLPILIQRFVQFESEWRVILVNGKSLGIAKKQKKTGVSKPFPLGYGFVSGKNSRVEKFVEKNSLNEGIFGVDVAVDMSGKIYIIEENLAPRWKVFQEVTGINVAKEIIKIAFESTKK